MTDEIINCIKGVLTEHELMRVREALDSRTPTPTAKLNIGEGIYMEVCPSVIPLLKIMALICIVKNAVKP